MARSRRIGNYLATAERDTRPVAVRNREAFAELQGDTVQEKTRSQYLSRFEQMEDYRKWEGLDEKWTFPLFTRFLQLVKRLGFADAESFRAALIYHLELNGEDVDWLRRKITKKLTQTIRFWHVMKQIPRGSVSGTMLRGLMDWLIARDEKELAVVSFLLHDAALRGSELICIQKGDFRMESADQFVLTIRKDKRNRRTNPKGWLQEKQLSAKAFQMLTILAKDRQEGDELFQDGEDKIRKLRKLIKQAAVELKWPKDLKFDGPHVLRHGGTREVVERAKQTVVSELLNQSQPMVKHYSRSNQERL